jgi:ribose 5-phosphate isomerase B
MKIAIGSDHAGFGLKQRLIEYLTELGIIPDDKGTYSLESTDYPPFAHAVSNAVENGQVDLGILICGSANGVAMTANKHVKIRCAICWNNEIAELARAHNDANIIAIPARFVTDEMAIQMVDSFLNVKFEGGRHQRRIDQIPV